MLEDLTPITLSRAELYEQLWTTPILRLARRYGVPYTELIRVCERHQVPRPSQGYWSKIRSGGKSDRIPLPANTGQEPIALARGYRPSGKNGSPTAERTSRSCTACRESKPFNEFYKKGSRFDSRCKTCVLKLKASERRKPLGVRPGEELMALGEQRRIAEGYPRVEVIDGKIVVVDRVYFPLTKTEAKPERILELYHENPSIPEIAKSVGRTPRAVIQALNGFGIKVSQGNDRERLPSEAPYGWKARASRLVPHPGEQWLLEKIEGDLRANRSIQQVANHLKSAGVRFRPGRSWAPESIEAALKKNRKLMQILCKPSGLPGCADPVAEDLR